MYDRFDEFLTAEEKEQNKKATQVNIPQSKSTSLMKKQQTTTTHLFQQRSSPIKKTLPSTADTLSPGIQTLPNIEIELLAGLEKLRNCLKEWLDGYTSSTGEKQQNKTDNDNFATKQSKNYSSDDGAKRESFNSRVFSFLSKNPDWSNEATISEDFQQKMKLKNDEKVFM